MNNKKQNKKTNKEKKINANEKSMKILNKPFLAIIYCLAIILISLVAIFGIYVQDKTEMVNILPQYNLGSELYGRRELLITPEEEEGQELSQEEKVENYIKSRDVLIERLKDLNLKYYEYKFNEFDGNIRVEVPENDDADYVSEYLTTKGYYTIIDTETEEVLLSNKDIKQVQASTYASQDGTTVYFTIEFNKDVVEKLKEISKTYVKSEDEEGNDTSKTITMKLDESTMMTSSFEEEIPNGIIQLTMGTSKDETQIEEYVERANRIAVLLNHDTVPTSYSLQSNRFVNSYITKEILNIFVIAGAIILAVLSVFMIVKYKLEGILGALTNIGCLALLLIIIRYTNVNLTLLGILGIAVVSLINYLLVFNILKINADKDIDKNEKQIEIDNTLIKHYERLIPIGIIAIIFALTSWETMVSLGTVLFWGIIIIIVYSLISSKILFLSKKTKKQEKKQEFHQM